MPIHFPIHVAKKMFTRLIVLGTIVALVGGVLIYSQKAAQEILNLDQPMLIGLLCMAIGILFISIAIMSLVLQKTWMLEGIRIRSSLNSKEIDLKSGDVELAEIDLDVDENDGQPGSSTRFKRGENLRIALNIKALKTMEISKATCTLWVKQRSKTDHDRLSTVFKKVAGDIANRRRNIQPNQRLKFGFEHQLPADLAVSSYNTIWKLRFEINAKGAADYLQDLSLTIS